MFLFWFYFLFFGIPLLLFINNTKGYEQDQKNGSLVLIPLVICSITITFFLSIECMQAKDQGIEYFYGWNIIDTLQVLVFYMIVLTYFEYGGILITLESEIRIMVMIMSFGKFLNLARVYKLFGCFFRMLEICFLEQKELICAYIAFLIFFAFSYQSLNVSSLGQPTVAYGLSHFGHTLFSLWRTYLLYIDIPLINNFQSDNDKLTSDEQWFQDFHNFIMYVMFMI